MTHIKRINEISNLNESKIVSVEKNENNTPYYIVKRLYQKKGQYQWVDEDRTFNSVDEAMRYIKTNIGYGEKYSLPRFQIFMETPIQMVIGEE